MVGVGLGVGESEGARGVVGAVGTGAVQVDVKVAGAVCMGGGFGVSGGCCVAVGEEVKVEVGTFGTHNCQPVRMIFPARQFTDFKFETEIRYFTEIRVRLSPNLTVYLIQPVG